MLRGAFLFPECLWECCRSQLLPAAHLQSVQLRPRGSALPRLLLDPAPFGAVIPPLYCPPPFAFHSVDIMQPKLKLTPRKIGVQGPSIKKRESSKQPDFTKDEIAELKRLSVMLPPRAGKEQDPAQLVLNAANYIQQLVATVRARVHNGTLPIEALAALPPGSAPSFRRESRKKRRSIEKQR